MRCFDISMNFFKKGYEMGVVGQTVIRKKFFPLDSFEILPIIRSQSVLWLIAEL